MADKILKGRSPARVIFDALPSPALVLSEDLKVLDSNLPASHFFGTQRKAILSYSCGEVLQCINEKESAKGCGYSAFCKHCVIRIGVSAAMRGKRIHQNRYDMKLWEGKDFRMVNFLVTASPFMYKDNSLALVILEDISELSLLKKIIPICAHCKKIRNEENKWESLDDFFSRHSDLKFSHGVCPDCSKILYPNFGSESKH